MRAIHIQKYGRTPILTTCPKPVRQTGQFLIKMKYAPINPSDLNFYLGSYGIRKDNFPIMGFQGSGIIEECEDSQMIGTKISVLSNMTNGTYADYLVANANQLIFWPKNTQINVEELSMFCINPLSVLGLIEFVNQHRADTIVLSAATSNVNKMIIGLIRKKYQNKIVLGLSRTNQCDDQLKALGLNNIYRMQQISELKTQLKNHGKTVFLDCVGGNFAGQVFNVLPSDSIMVNYGRLSKQNLGSIDLSELYFKNKFIRGFWLNTYLKSISEQKQNQLKKQLVENAQIFKQKIRKIFALQQFVEATRQSIKNQSEGKILLSL